jgi:hypothetical protein
MLEIIAIIFLTRSNGNKAEERGRNPVVFILLTVLFWIGFEFLGAFMAAASTRGEAVIATYIVALIAAVIGGFTPRLILAMVGRGNYQTSAQKAAQKALRSSRVLNAPTRVTLINSMVDTKNYRYNFYHNGMSLGVIPSNNQIVLPIVQSVNVISVFFGNGETAPFILTLNDGETAEVVLAKGKLQRRS